jgi:hypothetical protein
VHRQYRRLTPDVRADHILALTLIGRMVTEHSIPPTDDSSLRSLALFVRRSFVVMTIPGPGH